MNAFKVTNRRTEIEGLRTVAVTLVMIYHVWVGRVSGGVDVFFVVTGFFITTLILRQVVGGRTQPIAFLGRLCRRLMPSASVVLLFIGIITVLFAPQTLRQRNFEEIIASALSVENLYLAFNAIDYLNAADPATPAQHFWAMSLQAQFYLLWLLVGCAALVLVKLFSADSKRTMLWVVLAVFVTSLGLSIWQTHTMQPFAYFVPWTRMWEFAIGALVALLGSRLHLKGVTAGIASWLALITLVLTGAVLPVDSGFPGIIAAVPALAASAILISTREDERWWAGTRLLSWRPFVWLGSMAFGIYLWHWPLFMLFKYLYGLDATPGILAGAVIMGGSVLLAFLTKRLLEDPLRAGWQREGTPKRAVAAALVVAWVTSVSVPIGSMLTGTQLAVEREGATTNDQCYGHRALVTGDETCAEELATEPLRPSRGDLRGDIGDAYECYTNADEHSLRDCAPYGPEDGLRVAIIGNSHAAMMTPPLRQVAEERGWNLTVLVGNGCVWTTASRDSDCGERLAQQEELLLGNDPFDVVIAVGSAMENRDEYPIDTVRERFHAIIERGSDLIVIEDNARLSEEQRTCLLEATDAVLRAGGCDMTEEEGFDFTDGYWEVAQEMDDVVAVPTRDLFCAEGVCPLVIGGLIVYRDGNHLTLTYLESIFPELMERIDDRTEALLPASER